MKFEEMSEKGFDKFSSPVCQTGSKSLGKVGRHLKLKHNEVQNSYEITI